MALTLEARGVDDARRERMELLGQIDDYLLPRLERMDAPLLAVIGGSTGAGKSTLTNSLVRRMVTRSGVLRPTTRSPVLIHHPFDSGAFLSARILPGLARVTSEAPEPLQPIDVDAPRVTSLRLVPDESLAPGLAIIDAPDIDSVVEANRDLAVQLLDAADLWVFVTTAARYADAAPWDALRRAVERGVAVAVVLDRVPPESVQEIRLHLATLLRDRGLATAPMFTICETVLVDGFLPPDAVAPLLGWLTRISRDQSAREVVMRRTLGGALVSLHERGSRLVTAAQAQAAADEALRTSLTTTFAAAGHGVATALADGTVLRGEVLALWRELAGTGDLVKSLDAAVSRVRDRLAAGAVGEPGHTEDIGLALQRAVHGLVSARCHASLDDVAARWRDHPAGVALLAGNPEAITPAAEFSPGLAAAIQDWSQGLPGQLADTGIAGRKTPRNAPFSLDAAAALLMLVTVSAATLASTGRPAPGAAAGPSAVARRILAAVHGDDAVQALAGAAYQDLVRSAVTHVDAERARLEGLLGPAGARAGAAGSLHHAVHVIDQAR
jgi:GTPase SAR1 family protein